MTASHIPDLAERRRALDPAHSFIVQAPAGSGKTELLIQRYLLLLAHVDHPEEVIAVTFTKKAAGEMRERVLEAFAAAEAGKVPETGHEKLTLELANAALARDTKAGWRIAENPARLRVQTIDSLCAALTRQMPILSKFGSQPESVEDASGLYLEAARATVELIESDDAVAQDIGHLLTHLDNNVGRIEELLADMLKRRDHWLRHVHGRERAELQAALQNARRVAIEQARSFCHPLPNPLPSREREQKALPSRERGQKALPSRAREPETPLPTGGGEVGREGVVAELIELTRYAAANLAAAGASSAVIACDELVVLPGVDESDVAVWLGIAELLLTRTEGAWRRKFDIRDGFPAGKTKSEKTAAKHWKDRALALVDALAADDPLRAALHGLRQLPPSTYTEDQWEVLGAILRLLPRAVVQLKFVFQSRGQVDFTEVSQASLRALATDEGPTDLALALDYRIRHLLIDEFQDTSISQYELVARLTAGWEPDDGRTVFAVGDPMQSIYRFREAEVGLFLRARALGIGGIDLQPIRLTANFRSQAGIVEWVNATFAQVMPGREDAATGAVPHTASVATRPALDDAAVSVHPFFNADRAGEAARVVEIVTQARRDDAHGRVAILVRNRGHLREIVPQLKDAGLRFRAIDIEELGHRPVVQDLLVLTRALSHPADRLAWLAMLRAPWCGLTLADLHALAASPPSIPLPSSPTLFPGTRSSAPSPPSPLPKGEGSVEALMRTGMDREGSVVLPSPLGRGTEGEGRFMGRLREGATLWELMNDASRIAALSPDGRTRLLRVHAVLKACLEQRCRGSLRERIAGAWFALGGPACVEDTTDLEDAEIYFEYLETHEKAGEIADPVAFEEGLAKLYALPDLQADETLQIMTIHKAKGLEFDIVIVPGLGRPTRSDDPKLFLWTEQPRAAPLSMNLPARAGSTTLPSRSTPVRISASTLPSPFGRGDGGEGALLLVPGRRVGDEGRGGEGATDLLLAPIQETGADGDPIYAWLQKLEAEKESFEAERLLYVAATRARRRLHLLGDTRFVSDKNGEFELKPPARNVLLGKLWPMVKPIFAAAATLLMESNTPLPMNLPSPSVPLPRGEGSTTLPSRSTPVRISASTPPSPFGRGDGGEGRDATAGSWAQFAVRAPWSLSPGGRGVGGEGDLAIDQSLRRLVSGWQLPAPPPRAEWKPPTDVARAQDEIEFSWVGETARHAGSVVHRWLQRIADDAAKGWDEQRVAALRKTFGAELAARGVPENELDAAVRHVTAALTHAVTDERGRWLLGPQQDACNERRITAIIDGEPMNLVIDRMFLDTDGRRWIVDYKTSSHEGADVEAFLDRERERYQAQLARYASALGAAPGTMLGLYFPLLAGWREWRTTK